MNAMMLAKNTAHTAFGCVNKDACNSGFEVFLLEVDAIDCGVDAIYITPFFVYLFHPWFVCLRKFINKVTKCFENSFLKTFRSYTP